MRAALPGCGGGTGGVSCSGECDDNFTSFPPCGGAGVAKARKETVTVCEACSAG